MDDEMVWKNEGVNAFEQGKALSDSPYDPHRHRDAWLPWCEGWRMAQRHNQALFAITLSGVSSSMSAHEAVNALRLLGLTVENVSSLSLALLLNADRKHSFMASNHVFDVRLVLLPDEAYDLPGLRVRAHRTEVDGHVEWQFIERNGRPRYVLTLDGWSLGAYVTSSTMMHNRLGYKVPALVVGVSDLTLDDLTPVEEGA